MNLFGAISSRYRALGVLAVTAALAGALGSGGPASAALSGSDWVAQSLPAGFAVGTAQGPIPVSCVAGTQFCVVVANDTNGVDGSQTSHAALITTDGGRTWTAGGTMLSTFRVVAVSCPSTSVCWAVGWNSTIGDEISRSTDGGQTWTDLPGELSGLWTPNGIDCPTTSVCYVVGATGDANGLISPVVAVPIPGEFEWQVITNLPTFTPHSPLGTYELYSISCVTAQSCVAAGGLPEVGGMSVVISTANGGSTWTMSADPALSGLQEIFSIACTALLSGPPTCHAAGANTGAAGAVVLVSQDGGSTWGDRKIFDDTGWFQSISCASARFCWAAGAGTTVGLAGTRDGGTFWAPVTSATSNEEGSVSCLSVDVCVAATDNALWVTTDDGGLGGSPQRRPGTR